MCEANTAASPTFRAPHLEAQSAPSWHLASLREANHMASVEAVLIAADIDAVAANFAEASLCGANNAASKTHLAPHLEA